MPGPLAGASKKDIARAKKIRARTNKSGAQIAAQVKTTPGYRSRLKRTPQLKQPSLKQLYKWRQIRANTNRRERSLKGFAEAFKETEGGKKLDELDNSKFRNLLRDNADANKKLRNAVNRIDSQVGDAITKKDKKTVAKYMQNSRLRTDLRKAQEGATRAGVTKEKGATKRERAEAVNERLAKNVENRAKRQARVQQQRQKQIYRNTTKDLFGATPEQILKAQKKSATKKDSKRPAPKKPRVQSSGGDSTPAAFDLSDAPIIGDVQEAVGKGIGNILSGKPAVKLPEPLRSVAETTDKAMEVPAVRFARDVSIGKAVGGKLFGRLAGSRISKRAVRSVTLPKTRAAARRQLTAKRLDDISVKKFGPSAKGPASKRVTKADVAKEVPKQLVKGGKGRVKLKALKTATAVQSPAGVAVGVGTGGAGATLLTDKGQAFLQAQLNPKYIGRRTETSLQAVSSIVPGLVAIAGDVFLTGQRSAATALYDMGIPKAQVPDIIVPVPFIKGGTVNLGEWHVVKDYSGKQITPLKGQVKQQLEYWGTLADLVEAGDVDRWNKALNNTYGYTLIPTAALAGTGGLRTFAKVAGKNADAASASIKRGIGEYLLSKEGKKEDRVAKETKKRFNQRDVSKGESIGLPTIGASRARSETAAALTREEKGAEGATSEALKRSQDVVGKGTLGKGFKKNFTQGVLREEAAFLRANGRFPLDWERARPRIEARYQELLASGRTPGDTTRIANLGPLKSTRTGRTTVDVYASLLRNPELWEDPKTLEIQKTFEEGSRLSQDLADKLAVRERPEYGKAIEYDIPLPDQTVPRALAKRGVVNRESGEEFANMDELKAAYDTEVKEGRRLEDLEKATKARLEEARRNGDKQRIKELDEEFGRVKAERMEKGDRRRKMLDVIRGRLTREEKKQVQADFLQATGAKSMKQVYADKKPNGLMSQYRAQVAAITARKKQDMLQEQREVFRGRIAKITREENLNPRPVYTYFEDAREWAKGALNKPEDYRRLENDPATPFEGLLQKQGNELFNSRYVLQGSIVRPVVVQAQYAALLSFLEDFSNHEIKNLGVPGAKLEDVSGGRGIMVYESQDLYRAADRDKSNRIREQIDGSFAVPWQDIAKVLRKRQGKEMNPDIALDELIGTSSSRIADDSKRAARASSLFYGPPRGGKSRKYVLVPAARGQEFFDQLKKERGKGLRALTRAQSKLVLGLSPAWLAWQIPAEFTQATIAGGRRMVTPDRQSFADLTPEQRNQFHGIMGQPPGVGSLPLNMGNRVAPATAGLKWDEYSFESFANVMNVLSRTPVGRGLSKTARLEWLGILDQAKGRYFRSKLARAHIDRELNGMFANAPTVFGLTRKATEELRKMPKNEQITWLLEKPEGRKALAEVAKYVEDMLGNWSSYTRREQIPASLAFFYPFLRMSTKWLFYSLPKHHPARAALLYQIGAANSSAVKDLIGGDPQFLALLFQSPLHTRSEGDSGLSDDWIYEPRPITEQNSPTAPTMINTARMNPAGSPLFEALTDLEPTTAINLLQPVIGNLIAGVTGIDPFTGEPLTPKGATRDSQGRLIQKKDGTRSQPVMGLTGEQRLKYVATNLAGLPLPLRLANQGRSVYAGELPAFAGGEVKRSRGLLKALLDTPRKKQIKALGAPLPSVAQKQRDLKRVMFLLSKITLINSEIANKQYDKNKRYKVYQLAVDADNARYELNQLSRKYGVPVKPWQRSMRENFEATGRREYDLRQFRYLKNPSRTGDLPYGFP